MQTQKEEIRGGIIEAANEVLAVGFTVTHPCGRLQNE